MTNLKRVVSVGILWLSAAVLPAAAEQPEEVRIGAISLQVPSSWQQQQPSNRLRLGQFSIPPADGDDAPAELSIFNFGGGGGVEQQIERWKGQFHSEGREFSAQHGESPLGKYVIVDLAGTYQQPVGPPIRRQTKDVPGARMLVAMISVGDQGHYFLKLVGSQKTVAANVAAFRQAFGADSDQEKPLAESSR